MKHKSLKIEQLFIDRTYQRDFDERRAKVMAENYDPAREGIFFVSNRGGERYAILDGQHRFMARQLAGRDARILCVVLDGLNLEGEADMFLKLNGGRTAVGAISKFKAEVVAGHPAALEIKKILNARKLAVQTSKTPGSICAIDAVKSAFHHGQNLAETLDVLIGWGDRNAAYFDGNIIRAISVFLRTPQWLDVIDRDRLMSKLMPWSPDRLRAKIRREQEMGASPDRARRFVFMEIYNNGRSNKGKLPPLEAEAA